MLGVAGCYDDAPAPWLAADSGVDTGATQDASHLPDVLTTPCGPAPTTWTCTDCVTDLQGALACVDGEWTCPEPLVPDDLCFAGCPRAPTRCCDDEGTELGYERCDGPVCSQFDEGDPFGDEGGIDPYCGGLWRCDMGTPCLGTPCGERPRMRCVDSCEALNEVLEVCVDTQWQCPGVLVETC
jgi:hypothetical protein